ncbi:hypothetical protein [Bosea sp. Tri-44]|uniref:hypothetical protein n=1 Tax=Bosea sp. Tri-44 TaxID=1972137 RepID=UPI00100E549A|nr:hypothetical protein [Bosea sp. Tri-44]
MIKRYSSPEEWLRGEERMLGPSRLTHIFFGIIDTYWEWTSQSDRSDDPAMRDALEGYGEERDSLLHGLINDIVIELERPVEEPERPAVLMDASGERVIAPPPQTDDESHFQRFRMGMSGEINTDEYISVAFHRRMAERYMWQSLGTYAATSFKEQVVFLKYLDIQADRPWLRAATTIAYSIGALLLALPTLHTFGAIVSSAWRAA